MAYLLLVDDDADGREVLAQSLEKSGHEVARVPNGREALQSILSRTPSLILLDLLMPEMDGAELLEVVRSYLRFHPLPVILLTAYPESPEVERVRKLGVTRVLTKSQATLDEILKAIDAELHYGGFPPESYINPIFWAE